MESVPKVILDAGTKQIDKLHLCFPNSFAQPWFASMVCEERRRREDKLAQAFYRCTQVHDSGGKLVLVFHLVQWLTRKNPKRGKRKKQKNDHGEPLAADVAGKQSQTASPEALERQPQAVRLTRENLQNHDDGKPLAANVAEKQPQNDLKSGCHILDYTIHMVNTFTGTRHSICKPPLSCFSAFN